ncbi:hypothetical protein ACHHYP_15251 [Achlya hypogyna]|uniref:Tudor domain-containing protein n=1 Tax=Achlya hypogyna TaxID=1202772 RepID=A0A1V9YB75_ACHHY|nr:hypothetical protein ACHHYP_15251 [Achlya hypogyna]
MNEDTQLKVEAALHAHFVDAKIDESIADYTVELILAAWEETFTTAMTKPRKKKAPPMEPATALWDCLASAIDETLMDAQPTLHLEKDADIRALVSTTTSAVHEAIYPPPPPESESEFHVGASCLAILEEDDDWHEAEITSVEHVASSKTLLVSFVEFDKVQEVPLSLVVLPDDIADDGDETYAGCAMCARPMNLTAHHLIPRQCHARHLKLGFSRDFLNRTIWICRQCHSKIHSTEDNKSLAAHYNTLEKLLAHESIAKYVKYAAKQKARVRPRGQKQR